MGAARNASPEAYGVPRLSFLSRFEALDNDRVKILFFCTQCVCLGDLFVHETSRSTQCEEKKLHDWSSGQTTVEMWYPQMVGLI
uniref:Uncharacterized protein n=1 Tax=Kalanchoe fedtschenkoi TaxID=63787 RepID=A0A7N0TLT3_KALFE